jgi:divalent metal cation (Fe/Co/Zn/Cd) transporter
MSLCPFYKSKNYFVSTFAKALGEPNKGVHSTRLYNTAVIDYIMSIVLAILVTIFTKIPLVLSTIAVLIVGIILHVLFGINTNSVKYLGLSCE